MVHHSQDQVPLKYGSEIALFPLRRLSQVKVLHPCLPPPVANPFTYLEQLIDSPSGMKPFDELIKRKSKVAIIISDITRPNVNKLTLPILINRLHKYGINDDAITILCALGIHRKHTSAEHKQLVGASLYKKIKVIDHNPYDRKGIVHLGTTSRGTPVEVHRLLTEVDHIILTGGIRFHYFAGFGGGRKSILPGVSSFQSCLSNHLLVLQPQGGKHPCARTGILKGNPVHEDMAEACSYLPSVFLINTILTPQGKLLKAVAGDVNIAFNQGCAFFKNYFSVPIQQKADLVVASCGGNPWDINFIQAHKTMEMASYALKEGGVMILLAACSQGWGNPHFLRWFNYVHPTDLENALRRNYDICGHTAYATFLKVVKYHTILLSSLPAEEVKKTQMTPASTIEEALDLALDKLGPSPLTYLIPEGSSLLPLTDS